MQNEMFNRFKESFIKQFANIEHKRLCSATATATETITLVAIDEITGACTGSLDICPNFPLAADDDAVGAPNSSSSISFAYIRNVVVALDRRRSGVGQQLIQGAKQVAAEQLRVTTLYAHVESVNDAASGLYSKCGFVAVSSEGGVAEGTVVGQRTLLRCEIVFELN